MTDWDELSMHPQNQFLKKHWHFKLRNDWLGPTELSIRAERWIQISSMALGGPIKTWKASEWFLKFLFPASWTRKVDVGNNDTFTHFSEQVWIDLPVDMWKHET